MTAHHGGARLHWVLVTTAVLAAVAIFLRAPLVWLEPRFWTEEADIFFANAVYLPGVESLFVNGGLRAGYLNMAAAVATLIAARTVPLEFAPCVTLAFCAALLAYMLSLALFAPRRVLGTISQRVLLVGVLLFFPYASGTSEVWLSTTCSQVVLGVCALLLLMGDATLESRAERVVARFALALGGLSGPYTIALLPVFILRYLSLRDREDRVRASIVAACAAVQVGCLIMVMLQGHLQDAKSVALLDPARYYCTSLFQVWFPIFGEYPASALLLSAGLPLPQSLLETGVSVGWMPVFVFGGAAFGVILALAYTSREVLQTRLAVLALLLWMGMTTMLAVRGVAGYRYAVAPGTALGILALLAATSPRGTGRALRYFSWSVLVLGLLSGAVEFWFMSPNGTGRDGHSVAWSGEVARWRTAPDTALQVWPHPGWYTHLPEPQRLAHFRQTIARLDRVELTPVSPRAEIPFGDQGLPAVFGLSFLACRPSGSPAGTQVRLDAALVDASGRNLVSLAWLLPPGCRALELNSMALSFSGFSSFSAAVRLRFESAAAGGGGDVFIGGFRVGTPVLTVDHPRSGK